MVVQTKLSLDKFLIRAEFLLQTALNLTAILQHDIYFSQPCFLF